MPRAERVFASSRTRWGVTAGGALTLEGHEDRGGEGILQGADSIDELVDLINSDGSAVISEPADMSGPLDRLAVKFSEVADAAPTDELAEAFRAGSSMFRETAGKAMLAQISFRGRQPERPEDWAFLWDAIKRSMPDRPRRGRSS